MLHFKLALAVSSAVVALCHGQKVKPDPVFNCQNPNFQVIYTACSAGDYSKCCAVGTDCCAGGCCDLLSRCVGVGTSQETCCGFSDTTLCGTGSTPPQPSVACTGSTGLSSYYCPPGSTCDTRNEACIAPANQPSSKAPVPASSSSSPATPKTSMSTPKAAPTSSQVVSQATSANTPLRSSTAGSGPGASTSGSSVSVSVSVSVVTASPTATTTGAKSAAGSGSVGSFVMGIAVVGVTLLVVLL